MKSNLSWTRLAPLFDTLRKLLSLLRRVKLYSLLGLDYTSDIRCAKPLLLRELYESEWSAGSFLDVLSMIFMTLWWFGKGVKDWWCAIDIFLRELSVSRDAISLKKLVFSAVFGATRDEAVFWIVLRSGLFGRDRLSSCPPLCEFTRRWLDMSLFSCRIVDIAM